MFTSVDISNAIKEDGTWIMNRDVATFLRRYDFSNDSYERTVIVVTPNGKTARATLYHPDYADPSNYVKTNQKTLKKAEVDTKHPPTLVTQQQSVIVLTTATQASLPAIINSTNEMYECIVRERFRIPKNVVKAIGLKPGDKVDITKIDATLLSKISDKLVVTKDGRINIMAKNLKNRVSNIFVYENNGKIFLKV
jgi:antitoxin component of MazEF toxin-antitoxin module/pterin-4a-carbinolamine dehydratase